MIPMSIKKLSLSLVFSMVFTCFLSAQQTKVYTNPQKSYDHALELYQNKAYVAAQEKFNALKHTFENTSELRANCEFYAAYCAIRLGQNNADKQMEDFVSRYPTSTKRNSAFLDVANYYFNAGKYAYASKWFARVNTTTLSLAAEETYNFKYGYSLFVNKKYQSAKPFFLNLLDSQEYGSQAKYYYGYIAYNQDDFETADRYLGEIVDDKSFQEDVSYFLADMNFKLGKFDKSIELGLPLLDKVRRNEHSELSKIIGESYFNLQQYAEAIPHLSNYKGKRGKWTNTDYYLLGYAYYKQQDYENAINTFNKIVDGSNAVAQNAYYHLGQCYLEMNRKQEALNAFMNATQMRFKPEIQEDAWLNYAKLSYEIGNPYKSVPEVLLEYLELYPKSNHKTEINNLIISAYISSKDYEGALGYLKKKTTAKERQLYQQAAFFRGIELFQENNFTDAVVYFDLAIESSQDGVISSRSMFWKAEAEYLQNHFLDALNGFQQFLSSSAARNTPEFDLVQYNLGYTHFKLKDYKSANRSFSGYLNSMEPDPVRVNDSYLRIADGYFVNRDYSNAIVYYDKVITTKGPDVDYARFQKAISYGLTGNDRAKINDLTNFINTRSRSVYSDDAHFVLADTYLKNNDTDQALIYFDKLINNYPRSPLVSKAMLKKGLIYYNTDRSQLAITTYKGVVQRYPNTPEAVQAVKNTRQIYVDIGNVDAYASWVKTVSFVNVSDAELDNDMYESAEKQYLQNNHRKAAESFRKYLLRFPSGLHSLPANFYLAQALYAENRLEETIPYYTFVIEREQNTFTEIALSRLALVYLKNDNWSAAIPVLERLEIEADSPENITFAKTNLMKGYYAQENYARAEEYAAYVLGNEKLEDRIHSDAQIIIARSAIKTNNEIKARTAYKELEKIANGELLAEALYYGAFYENKDGSYKVSNQIVQRIASDLAAYKYWAAKGLIVMADNHYQLKDAFQATYILESVVKNFAQFDDVVAEAKAALTSIKTEESKTNESINNRQ
jgi:TolA-binding protein